MNIKRHTSFKIESHPLGIGIFFLILAGLLSIIWFNNQILGLRFQANILEDYHQLFRLNNTLKKDLNNFNQLNDSILNQIDKITNDDRLQILIYDKSGQLIYWHNNQYMFDLKEFDTTQDDFLTNNKGSFLYSIDSTDNFIIIIANPVWLDYAIKNENFQPQPGERFKKFGLFSVCSVPNQGFPIYNLKGIEIFSVQFIQSVYYSQWKFLIIILLIIFGFYISVNHIVNKYLKEKSFIYLIRIIAIFILFYVFRLIDIDVEFEYYNRDIHYIVIFNRLISYTELLVYSVLSALFIREISLLIGHISNRFVAKHSKYFVINKVLVLFIHFILLFLFYYIIDQVITNSHISFTPALLFNLSYINCISLLSLFILLYVLLEISSKIITIIQDAFRQYLLVISISVFIVACLSFIFKLYLLASLLITISLVLLIVLMSNRVKHRMNIIDKFFYIITISLVLAIYLSFSIEQREESKKQLLLMNIESMQQGDPITESLFTDAVIDIQKDTLIKNLINSTSYDPVLIENYILEKYFRGFWNQFHITLTLCKEYERIKVSPVMQEVNCYEYFKQLLGLVQHSIYDTSFLKIADYGHSLNGYIGVISFNDIPVRLFVEFLPNPSGNVNFLYDLVTTDEKKSNINLEGYSLARYYNNKLISFSGDASFPVDLPQSFLQRDTSKSSIIELKSGKFHYSILRSKNKSIYILANESDLLNRIISILGLLLIIYTIWGIFYFIKNLKLNNFHFNLISVKLQIIITIILLISFTIIGYFVYNFFNSNYKNQVKTKLIETVYSISSEFQYQTMEDPEFLSNDIILEAYIKKLSNIFFTDINLYDRNGELLVTTSPKLFQSQLLEPYIHRNAYDVLLSGRSLTFIQEEKIGNYKFFSAYIPFRDNEDRIVAYINLPQISQIASQQQQREKYLSALMSMFIFLLIFSLLIALFIANIIIKPLNILSQSLSQLRLGETNIKIPIARNDEIGLLIRKYNALIDKLDEAIQELKRKERDLAWKDMARQIAHEIKNPLTPIRLQIQFLNSSYLPNDPDWERKFKEFSALLIEQIDSLTQLADTFSDLGQITEGRQVKIILNEIIEEAANIILTEYTGDFIHHIPDRLANVKADRNQLLRVFINILKNASQAVQDQEYKLIGIDYLFDSNFVIVRIHDNGKGMTEEDKKQIFTPYFTTKSFGTGLGLYISKNIIEALGGTISFESDATNGTAFYVKLPLQM